MQLRLKYIYWISNINHNKRRMNFKKKQVYIHIYRYKNIHKKYNKITFWKIHLSSLSGKPCEGSWPLLRRSNTWCPHCCLWYLYSFPEKTVFKLGLKLFNFVIHTGLCRRNYLHVLTYLHVLAHPVSVCLSLSL